MAHGGKRIGAGKKKGTKASHTLQAQEARKALIAKYVENQEEIDSALIDKARDGDIYAIKEVYDRVYGKANQGIDMNLSGEKLSIDDNQLTQLIGARTARANNDKGGK